MKPWSVITLTVSSFRSTRKVYKWSSWFPGNRINYFWSWCHANPRTRLLVLFVGPAKTLCRQMQQLWKWIKFGRTVLGTDASMTWNVRMYPKRLAKHLPGLHLQKSGPTMVSWQKSRLQRAWIKTPSSKSFGNQYGLNFKMWTGVDRHSNFLQFSKGSMKEKGMDDADMNRTNHCRRYICGRFRVIFGSTIH